MEERLRESRFGAQFNEKDGSELVYVPGSTYPIGVYDQARTVTVDGYWIQKYPVTNEQYRKFCEETGKELPMHLRVGADTAREFSHPDMPVTHVSWEDANAYAMWAGMELCSEEEWEIAARGPEANLYPWGNEPPTDRHCNYFASGIGHITPVGKYPEGMSWCGCYDMVGNVWEWTRTCKK